MGEADKNSPKALKKLMRKRKKEEEANVADKNTTNNSKEISTDLEDATNSKSRMQSVDSTREETSQEQVKEKSNKPKRRKDRKLSVKDGEAGADTTSPERKKSKMSKSKSRSSSPAQDAVPAEPSTPKAVTAEEFCATHNIRISAENSNFECPPPMATFDSTPYGKPIRSALDAAGYPAPTPTQAQSWPIALSGRDIISVARTGSGKTLGFLLPAFHALLTSSGGTNGVRRAGPSILVLAPTRELACQINDEANKFGRSSNIRSAAIYGGAPKYPQIKAIQMGVQVVVATPGRLNDLMQMNKIVLSDIMTMALDEADRMLDMGFEPQIRTIFDNVPTKRQTLFFTATWPKEVQRLARDFVSDPVQITIGDVGKLNANKSITQHIHVVDQRDKLDKLWELLTELHGNPPGTDHAKTIIFVAKKRACDNLAQHAWERGFAVDSLHGDREQWERTKIMNQFRSGEIRLLVATDVAARGLDVKDIAYVINHDFPTDGVENYIHRIGRTARGEASGDAHTFFTGADGKFASKLVGVLDGANQEIPDKLRSLVRGGAGRGRGGGGRGGAQRWGGRGGGRGRRW